MKSLRSSKWKFARWTLQALLLTTAVVDQALPLVLRVHHDTEGSTTTSPANILLRKCYIKINAYPWVQRIRDDIFISGAE